MKKKPPIKISHYRTDVTKSFSCVVRSSHIGIFGPAQLISSYYPARSDNNTIQPHGTFLREWEISIQTSHTYNCKVGEKSEFKLKSVDSLSKQRLQFGS